MSHTSGSEFAKKSKERSLAKYGDIFVAPSKKSGEGIYLPEVEAPHHHTIVPQIEPPHVFVEPPKSVVYKHVMTRNEKLRYMAIRSLGNFLLLISLYGVIATFSPAILYEAQFRIAQLRGVQFNISKDNFGNGVVAAENIQPGFGDIIAGAKEQVLVPPDPRFSIIIPKIGAAAKIWPNVDPLSEKDFLPKLQDGVAHAKGSVFPGMQGNIYLFAHSTDNFWNVGRYNAIFYLLKELQKGDKISIYFEDTRYNFVVDHSVVKDPQDVDLLVNSQIPGKEQLILQTCWPPGTTWKRLFVIATPETQ
ncbi:MAG: sortase [Candidatus Levybacteria bacterium]|nr:sortase [Candidatus Levybacteria bacterium]